MENLLNVFTVLSEKCYKNEQFSYSELFNDTKKSLIRFIGKDSLPVSSLTKEFLEDYKKWLLKCGRKDGQPVKMTTVSIYIRQIRVIVNYAIDELGIFDKDNYPFGKRQFSTPNISTTKRALPSEDIATLLSIKLDVPSQALALDLWKLSYYCNGINFADLITAKWSDISNGQLTFVRRKSKGRSSHIEPISVYLLPEAIALFDKVGTEEKNGYILPYITQQMSEESIRMKIKSVTTVTNRSLKKVANRARIKIPITTYYARHSFSTTLMRNGVPTKFISKCLGHKSLTVTEIYLSSFESDQSKEYMGALKL